MKRTSRRYRVARIAGVAAVAAFSACQFGDVLGVADLDERRIIGMLTANHDADGERDRVYVGQHRLGTAWNPVEAKVVAIDALSGAPTGETMLWPEAPEIRAVAAAPDSEHVWTLHDEGSIVAWHKDLGPGIVMVPGFIRPPSGMTSAVFCDLEILPDGQFVATGVAFDGKERIVGYVHHKAPHPTWTGGYYPGWMSWETQVLPGEETELARYCPRVAYDDSTTEVVVLKRSAAFHGGDDLIARYEGYTFSGNFWGLSYVGGFNMAPRIKMRPVDVTAAYNHMFLLREYFDFGLGSPGGEIDIHHTDTGADEDTIAIEEARAVHWADFITDPNNPTALWWAGHDVVSDQELGMVETINDEPWP